MSLDKIYREVVTRFVRFYPIWVRKRGLGYGVVCTDHHLGLAGAEELLEKVSAGHPKGKP